MAACTFIEVVASRKFIHPKADWDKGASTNLSAYDGLIVGTGMGRAWGFVGKYNRIQADLLEAALYATVKDLPFLAGRMGGMRGMRLNTLRIDHSGPGAELAVVDADGVSVAAAMGADTWARVGTTISHPDLPFFFDSMDTGRSLLGGKEAVLKVRLTRCNDGDILAVTVAHAVVDGYRWPLLMRHLAARYRQAAGAPTAGGTGAPAIDVNTADLLRPTDRQLMSTEHMVPQLLGAGASWTPPLLRVRASLLGYWRIFKLLLVNSRQKMDLLFLHLPQEQVAQLKRLTADGSAVPGITTGDAVQAACGLLMHTAAGKPLLPVAPQVMMVLVQMPTTPGYFGNAVHWLRVSLPEGTAQPAPGDCAGALKELAGAIRRATAAFRSQPEEALKALADSEALAAAPAPRMLSFLAAKRLPLLTCTTNYIPTQQGFDLGLGREAAHDHEFTSPRARNMVVIRPAQAPYPAGGLFAQLCITPAEAARLRGDPLLRQLMPQASFVGGSSGSGQ